MAKPILTLDGQGFHLKLDTTLKSSILSGYLSMTLAIVTLESFKRSHLSKH